MASFTQPAEITGFWTNVPVTRIDSDPLWSTHHRVRAAPGGPPQELVPGPQGDLGGGLLARRQGDGRGGDRRGQGLVRVLHPQGDGGGHVPPVDQPDPGLGRAAGLDRLGDEGGAQLGEGARRRPRPPPTTEKPGSSCDRTRTPKGLGPAVTAEDRGGAKRTSAVPWAPGYRFTVGGVTVVQPRGLAHHVDGEDVDHGAVVADPHGGRRRRTRRHADPLRGQHHRRAHRRMVTQSSVARRGHESAPPCTPTAAPADGSAR